jgi:hypothetical protein
VSTLAHDAFHGFDARVSRISLLQIIRTFAIWLGIWTFVGLVFVGQDVTRRIFLNDPAIWMEVGFWAMRVVISAALTLPVLWLASMFPLEKRVWARRILLHVLFSLCFGLVRSGIEAVMYFHT